MLKFFDKTKKIKFIRNKYIVTIIIFVFYILFLDDSDIFSIVRQQLKLRKLKHQKEVLYEKFDHTKTTLHQLDNPEALERYAREKKFFKKDNEDIFVIVNE